MQVTNKRTIQQDMQGNYFTTLSDLNAKEVPIHVETLDKGVFTNPVLVDMPGKVKRWNLTNEYNQVLTVYNE